MEKQVDCRVRCVSGGAYVRDRSQGLVPDRRDGSRHGQAGSAIPVGLVPEGLHRPGLAQD